MCLREFVPDARVVCRLSCFSFAFIAGALSSFLVS